MGVGPPLTAPEPSGVIQGREASRLAPPRAHLRRPYCPISWVSILATAPPAFGPVRERAQRRQQPVSHGREQVPRTQVIHEAGAA